MRFPHGRYEANLQVLRLINPKLVIPYADGQVGIGVTKWVNHYRFPVAMDDAIESIRETLPECKIFVAKPGNRLELKENEATHIDNSAIMFKYYRAMRAKESLM